MSKETELNSRNIAVIMERIKNIEEGINSIKANMNNIESTLSNKYVTRRELDNKFIYIEKQLTLFRNIVYGTVITVFGLIIKELMNIIIN